jgi:hypothetical protein
MLREYDDLGRGDEVAPDHAYFTGSIRYIVSRLAQKLQIDGALPLRNLLHVREMTCIALQPCTQPAHNPRMAPLQMIRANRFCDAGELAAKAVQQAGQYK